MNVVALMPMRHSSERVPGKNYRPFNGKPLFHHMAKTILSCPLINAFAINTDSAEISDQCQRHFPDIKIINRPEHLLGGDVPMTEILRYDADQVPSDWYLQVHSTSPLLKTSTITDALQSLNNQLDVYDSLFSVTRLQTRLYASDFEPINHDPDVLLRTQDLPPVYEENSGMYIFSNDQIFNGKRFGQNPLLYEVHPLESLDIDEEADFVLAEIVHKLREKGEL